MIPALKGAVAHYGDDETWANVRPPLVALTAEQRTRCIAALRAIGFTMPGLADSDAKSAAEVSG